MNGNTSSKTQPWNSREIYKFNSFALASSFADRCLKLHMIVLGDDGKYWVALPRITEALVKLGYEYA